MAPMSRQPKYCDNRGAAIEDLLEILHTGSASNKVAALHRLRNVAAHDAACVPVVVRASLPHLLKLLWHRDRAKLHGGIASALEAMSGARTFAAAVDPHRSSLTSILGALLQVDDSAAVVDAVDVIANVVDATESLALLRGLPLPSTLLRLLDKHDDEVRVAALRTLWRIAYYDHAARDTIAAAAHQSINDGNHEIMGYAERICALCTPTRESVRVSCIKYNQEDK
ncbi:hypothetical protein SPRG_07552 [Saprolegnia parasitica CBS 223.65]|uniref:Armadillo repeat-containing protein 8 n=1 Tax=Saprolegnia parasitica (strain CBS 223.65) TaxID=695850 RepID=A0A067CKI5_SAPPC|nr:hypothetical protein SPRG_07552 [Saprolegnia parasitica CBS 223.65]KDO27302.1 hypothetical protein SPRG_07552 [Saprolegnia parasitica CBS 223.65]|eukprot:XP_012202076.1 hypothetical protein SPRG_07552 [Saprolegnia parasitica CBS 223.65]